MVQMYYLEVQWNICWCENFGDSDGKYIFVVYKCEQCIPSGCIGHSLMDESYECACVVKYGFVLCE